MNIYEIYRYSAKHPDWEGSFSERLYEHAEWDHGEFWKLHKELIDLSIHWYHESRIDKKIVGKILGIQQSIHSTIIAHYDNNDYFKITNITDEEIHQLKERIDTAIIALTSGDIMPESSFELKNPLLT